MLTIEEIRKKARARSGQTAAVTEKETKVSGGDSGTAPQYDSAQLPLMERVKASARSRFSGASTMSNDSNMTTDDFNSWQSGLQGLYQKGTAYLSSDGYRSADTELLTQIDDHLAKSVDVMQFVRTNGDRKAAAAYSKTIDGLRQMKQAVESKNDTLNQFESEEDYNAAVREAGYFDKYAGMEYDALRDAKYKLDTQSDEYRWLSKYAMTAVNSGNVDEAIRSVDKEIDALYKFEEEYGDLERWYNDYQAGNTVDSAEVTAEKLAMHKAIVERFGSYAGIRAMRRAKQAEKEQLEEIKAYGSLRDNADFESMSGVANTETLKNGLFDFSMDNPYYNYINDLDGTRSKVKNVPGDNPFSRFDDMTEEEIANYNYLYNTQGEKAAMAYLESDMLTEALNQRVAQTRYKAMQGNTGKELLFAIQSGLDQFGSGVKNLFNTEDYYIPATATQQVAALVREDLAKNGAKLPEWLGGASLGQAAFDAISTLSNMAPSILASTAVGLINPAAGAAVGSGLLGASAAGNAYTEMLNQGYSPEEARLYGVAVGVSEVVMERALGGISKLGGNALSKTALKNFAHVDNVLTRFAKSAGGKLLAGASSEALEEGLQSIIEPYLRYAAAQDKTEISVDMQEALYSALMGFATGGLFEAVNPDTYQKSGGSAYSQTVGKRETDALAQGMNGNVDINASFDDLHIKDQIRNSQDRLNGMNPVFEVNVPNNYFNMDRASKLQWVENKLRPTGFEVNRKGFGVIDFAMKRIKKAIRYFKKGSVEEAAFEAVPYVLESGIEISDHENHKGREYGTVTIAAPVTINGNRGNMAVVVKRTDGNHYKVHRVLTPDGSVFVLEDGTKETEPTTAGESPETGSLATPKGSASVNNLSQYNAEVKPQEQQATAQEKSVLQEEIERQWGVTAPQSAAQEQEIATGTSALAMTDDNGGTDNGTGVLHGSSQRNDGAGAGEPAGGLAGRAGTAAQRNRSAVDRIRKTNERRNLGKNLRLEKVSSVSLGVVSGTEKANLQVIPEEHWDDGLRAKANQVMAETGKSVVYVLGNIETKGVASKPVRVRGVITESSIIVQADNAKLSAEQIADHEAYHGMADVYRESRLNERLIEWIRNTFTKEEFDKVVDKYIFSLRETIDVEGAQTGEEKARRIRQAQEEVLADAYAGINSFGNGATAFTDTVRAYLKDNHISRENSQDNGTEQPTGPPAGQKENTADFGGERFSLMEFEQDGRRYVEIDQDQDRFDGKPSSEYPRIAKDIINEKFNGRVIGDDNRMFVNGAGRDEFANPSKPLSQDMHEVKMRTAGELDNLLDAGMNFRNRPDGADGHVHQDVVGGFDYFDVLFKIGNRWFEATINIKNVKKGKLFKDVTQIKEVTQAIMSSYGSNPKSQFLRTSSKSSIRAWIEKVNQKIQAVLDKVSPNHAAQMERYTELKDSDPDFAQKFYDGLMDSPYSVQFEEYLELTEELDRLERESRVSGSDDSFTERMSLDDSVADEDGESTDASESSGREAAKIALIEELRGLSPSEMMGDKVGQLIDMYTKQQPLKQQSPKVKVDRGNLRRALTSTLGLNKEQSKQLKAVLDTYTEAIAPKQKSKKKPKADIRVDVESRPTQAKKNFRKKVLDIFSVPAGKQAELMSYIGSFADRIVKNGALTEADRRAFFAKMYDAGMMTIPADQAYSVARSYLNKGRIYVNDSIRAEFGNDWNSFRKQAFGNGIYLTADKADAGVDVWQQRLYEDVGLIDPEETSMKEVLERIVQIAEEGRDEQVSLAEYVSIVAGEEFTSEDEILDGMERQLEWALKSFAESAQIEIDLKKRNWQEKAWEREQNRKKAQLRYEANQLKSLQKDTLTALAWLKKNRKRTPDEVKAKIDAVLGDIDVYAMGAANAMNWSDRYGATWADLATMIRQAEADYKGQWFISDELAIIRDRIEGVKLENIIEEEDGVSKLMDLFHAAIGLRHEIENRRALLADAKEREFAAVKAEVKDEIAASPERFRYGTVSQKLQEFMNEEQLTPLNFIQWLTGWNPDSTFLEMGKMFEEGARKVRQYKVEAAQMLGGVITKNRSWLEKADGQGKDGVWYTHKVKPLLDWRPGKETYGAEVEIHITPLQKVQLYLASQCEDNLRHIKCGGIMFADQALYSKGRKRWRDAFSRQKRPIRLTLKQVQALVADMTAKEQALADALKPYYNDYGKEHINEVSLQMLGYEKAMNSNYVPIHTYDDVFAKDPSRKGKKSAEGGVKERIEEANAAIVLESAIEVWERHVDKTALYCGMTIPTHNFKGFMNWSDFAGKDQADESLVWADISHKYGPKTKEYLENLIAEMNGNKEDGKSWSLLNKLFGSAIGATFYFNPKIWLKQVGSWFMAAPYLGVRNVRVGKVDKELIAKYTPDLAWRYMGYSSPEARMVTENRSDIHELMKKQKWSHWLLAGGNITQMDGGVAGQLWPWAEQKVRREFPDMEIGTQTQINAGESPFYQKVAEIFNNAVARSQSTSEDIYQSEIRKHPGMKPLTMFKSDSAQSYNAIRQKLGETLYYKRTGDKENARKTGMELGWAVLGTVVNNFFAAGVNLLVAAVFHGLKGYKNDDDEFDPEKFFEDALLGMTGLFIGGEEIAEVICNVLTGEKWYGIDIPGWEQLIGTVETGISCAQKLINFCTELDTVLDAGGDGMAWIGKHGHELLDVAREAAETLGSLYQFPVSNIKKYLFGFFQNAVPGLKQEAEDFLATPSKTSAEGLTGTALETRIGNILEGRGVALSEGSLEGLARLYEEGHTGTIPSDTPSSVTADNVRYNLNGAQQQTWDMVWGDVVDGGLEQLLELDAFAQADPEMQEKMVKALYDYASARAKAEVLDEYDLTDSDKKTMETVAAGAELAEYLAWKVATTDMNTEEKLGELAAWDMDGHAKKAIVGAVLGTNMETEKGNPSKYAKFLSALETGLSVDEYLEMCVEGGDVDKYLKYTEAGLDPQEAVQMVNALGDLKGSGDEKVTDLQRWRIAVDSQSGVDDQLAALSAVMDEKPYQKAELANEYGVNPNAYVDFLELLPEYNEDGKGNPKQQEITAAINAVSGKLRLTNEQKAVLWQIAADTKSAKNNPYSVEIGWKVVDALSDETLSFGEMFMRQVMAGL